MTKEENVKHVCLFQNIIIIIITVQTKSILIFGKGKKRIESVYVRMSRTLHEMVHDNN